MSYFSTWITLLILIGSAWSQTTPDTEPSARSLKFGFGLLDPVREQFCSAVCKNLGRFLFIKNIGCFVNCPELWLNQVTMSPNSTPAHTTTPTSAQTSTTPPK